MKMLNLNPLCFFLIAVALICTTSTSTQAQDLVQNGKFEKGITAWKVLLENENSGIKAQQIEQSTEYGKYGLADNYVNTSFVELDAQSAIQQLLTTNPNQTYTFSFAVAHRPDAGDKQLVVMADKEVLYTETIKNSSSIGGFKYKTLQFTPTASLTKISFYAVSLSGADDQGLLVTDISCQEAEEVDLKLERVNKF